MLYKKVVIAKNKTVKMAVLMTSLCHFIASYDISLLKIQLGVKTIKEVYA